MRACIASSIVLIWIKAIFLSFLKPQNWLYKSAHTNYYKTLQHLRQNFMYKNDCTNMITKLTLQNWLYNSYCKIDGIKLTACMWQMKTTDLSCNMRAAEHNYEVKFKCSPKANDAMEVLHVMDQFTSSISCPLSIQSKHSTHCVTGHNKVR